MSISLVEPAQSDFDRHFRRAVWIAWIVTMVGGASMFASKSADERGAFVRWRHQILDFQNGANIWDTDFFPYPPIFPISTAPIWDLPPVAGAVTWFTLKSLLTVASILLCFRMINATGKILPSWVQGAVLLLSLRPILSDQHHGNVNLVILFLIVATLYAWRRGYDVLAGLLLALAISYKVTPALFVPYFLFKREWRVAVTTMLGVGLFLLVVPSLALGIEFNAECLAMWWHRILSPYVGKGEVSPQEVNQSMAGVLTRLLVEVPPAQAHGYSGTLFDLNLLSWPRETVTTLIKILSVGFVGLLAYFSRTKATRRDDPRLFGEWSLVVLTMLFVSERSWKHHFVTLLLPYTFLAYHLWLVPATRRTRWLLASSLVLSAVVMASTSSEIGGVLLGEDGHKVAQFYGMFLWSAMILYVATAWRVMAVRSLPSEPIETAIQTAGPHFRSSPEIIESHRPNHRNL
jgi:hypothetical protein